MPRSPALPSSVNPWVSLGQAARFLLTSGRIMGWSLLLVAVTLGLTWGGYLLTTTLMDQLTGNFFQQGPEAVGIWGWIKFQGWQILKWLFLVLSRLIAFYLAFFLAYTLTTPGYVFLSTAVEKKKAGREFEADAPLTWIGVLVDLREGLKIALVGVLLSVLAFGLNFIPLIGQVLVVLIYSWCSALMFIDYPTARRRWTLGRKMAWLRGHWLAALRLGLLAALLGMIPVLNIFVIALLFPLFTVHATLNFLALEGPTEQGLSE